MDNYESRQLLPMSFPKPLTEMTDKELTDEELAYLIEYEYYDSIGKLEKDVGAGKNQLRNRYNKAKKKQKIESDEQKCNELEKTLNV